MHNLMKKFFSTLLNFLNLDFFDWISKKFGLEEKYKEESLTVSFLKTIFAILFPLFSVFVFVVLLFVLKIIIYGK